MNLKRYITTLFALAALMVSMSLTAAAQYHFDNWTTDTGLWHNTIKDILQTRDGYLWLATPDGLVRYDGVRFTAFNKGNTPGIGASRLSVLYEDREGNLWIGAADGGGLIRYRNGTFTTFTAKDGLPGGNINVLQGDAAGNLWVIAEKGICRRTGEEFFPFTPTDPRSKNPQPARSLSYVDGEGLHRFARGQWMTYTGLSSLKIVFAYEDQRGVLWVLTSDAGLNRVEDGRVTLYPIKSPLPYVNPVWGGGVIEGRKGEIWIDLARTVYRLKDGTLTAYPQRRNEQQAPINSIHLDREGNLWIGSEGYGLFRLREEVITTYTTEQGLVGNNVYPVYADREGNIWIGAWGSGLSRFAGSRVQQSSVPLFDNFTQARGSTKLPAAFYEDREGRLWIGTYGDVEWFKDWQFHLFPLPGVGSFQAVTAIYEDRDGNYWFGANIGLVKYRDGATTLYGTAQGLAGNEVKVLLEDRDGSLWIGTYGGLSHLKDGRFTSWTEKDGLAGALVRALYQDREGTLWVGTYDGGLTRIKDGRLTRYTPREGLFDYGVFQILEDGRGNLWMSSNRGIYRVRKQELDDLAEGRRTSITSVSYDKSDGMRNVECNGGHSPAGAKARDGRLWFPTQEGVAVVNSEAIPLNPLPPPVVIEAAILDHAPVPFHESVQIKPGQGNLEIQYTGLSFIKPEQVRFKYQLEGLDKGWVEAGARRTVYYPYLPPGEYTFRVMAANSDGVWNTEGAAVKIIILPPFYRAWWFISLMLLGAAGIGVLVYEGRLLRLKKAHAAQAAFSRQLIESQEEERKRIAAELHDGLGQNLLVIKNRALLGLMKREDQTIAFAQLEEISATVAHSIEEVRSIAHNLRPYQLDRLGLTLAIESIVTRVADSTTIKFSAEVDPVDHLFSPEVEINLYRMVQEGVNNIVKHSGTTEAQVLVKREDHSVRVTVADNGRGFDLEHHATGHMRQRGFGLVSITERARMIGANSEIRSAPGRGMTITITLNLPGEGKEAHHDHGEES